MNDTTTVPHAVSATCRLAQADVLLMVRDVLVQPITTGMVMSDFTEADDLADLFTHAGIDDPTDHAERLIPLWRAAVADGGAELAQAHCDLFEGSVPCPVTETAYIRRDKGAILADITGFYHAFGFEPAALGEKADHIAVELEFAAMLLVMWEQAVRAENTEAAEVTEAALRSFTTDHIGEWVLAFCDRLRSTSALPLHEASAELLAAGWRAIVMTHGLEALAVEDAPLRIEDATGPYECGMAEAAQPVELTANRLPLPGGGTSDA